MKRAQIPSIINDLDKKMVFITGPRQVGKTWISKEIAKTIPQSLYLNYDAREDRKIIEEEAWLDTTRLLILDELHKMDGWKNYLKGVFDTRPDHLKILVTGSARLEAFRHSGDSLAGRYFRHRLLPFSPAELVQIRESVDLEKLTERSGFPEPFLAESNIDADRWRMQYLDGLIRTDILDFENVHDLRAMQLVLDLLRYRVGSPASYSSLAEDVGIAPNTVKKYIQILESLFIVFKVTPFSTSIARSVKKEPKIYFFDTALVNGDDGKRFENIVALSLLKHVYARVDQRGQPCELHYLRTKDKKEVDFCVACNNMPELMIEVKLSKTDIGKGLTYFNTRYGIPGILLVKHLKREKKAGSIDIRRGNEFLSSLML